MLAAIEKQHISEKGNKTSPSPSAANVKSKSNEPHVHQESPTRNRQNETERQGIKRTSPGKDSLKSAQSIGSASIRSSKTRSPEKHENGSLDVDDFVPSFADDVAGSGGGIDNFLDSQEPLNHLVDGKSKVINATHDDSSDDEVVKGNPMVARIMEDDSDIELDDVVKIAPAVKVSGSSRNCVPRVAIIPSSSDDEGEKRCHKTEILTVEQNTSNSLVKKLSNVSISGSSDKSSSSRKSHQKNQKEQGNGDITVFDLNSLALSYDKQPGPIGDEKPKRHHKKHKKDKKDSKKNTSSGGGGKRSKKTKEERERDDLEEFLNGTISMKKDRVEDGGSNFALPESYEEL